MTAQHAASRRAFLVSSADSPRALRLATLTAVAILCAAISAFAQSRVEGRVVDQQDRPIRGATVVAIGATTAPLTVSTNNEGQFAGVRVAAGR